jgi:hypothetical protein
MGTTACGPLRRHQDVSFLAAVGVRADVRQGTGLQQRRRPAPTRREEDRADAGRLVRHQRQACVVHDVAGGAAENHLSQPVPRKGSFVIVLADDGDRSGIW